MTTYFLGALFALNIAFTMAVWHMDLNHHLDLEGARVTRGIFKIKPETAYRISEYALIGSLFLIDILVLVLLKQGA